MKAKPMKLTVKHSINVFWDEETQQFVGVSKELQYTGIGGTTDEARDNTNRAVELALQWCSENGTLEEVLKEAGYQVLEVNHQKVWEPKEPVANFPSEIAV